MKRRRFLQLAAGCSATVAARPTRAFGDSDLFTIGVLNYRGGNPNPRPGAPQRLLLEVELTTSVLIRSETPLVPFTAEAVFNYPFLILAGDQEFPEFSDEEREVLRTWLSAGGFLFVDSSEGRVDGGFERSLRREMEWLVPDSPLQTLDDDHVVYRSFYLINDRGGRTVASPDLQGSFVDGRLAVLYSPNDHMGAWARDNFGNYAYSVFPGGETQRTMAIRFGVNLVMYALCLDYKADQVHVEYLLRRRRWQVGP